MGNEKFYMESCSCHRARQMNVVHCLSTISLVVLLGIFPYGSSVPHIASVLENGDDVPGIPMKHIPRGPTVAPAPSPETLKHLELLNRREGDESIFSPGEAIRSLFSISSSSPSHRGKGLKRVSQFHGDVGRLLGTGSYHRRESSPDTWEYDDENGMMEVDEDGQPTFVPFIGARALTNIPQFFEHLKENIEALKLSPPLTGDGSGSSEGIEDSNGGSEDDNLNYNFEARPPKKDSTKPAARRMKTEFHVDENPEDTNSWSAKQNWKPRAAGIIHYYAPKENFLQPHQNILRRANNYNPAWLYTNLGLGKRRR